MARCCVVLLLHERRECYAFDYLGATSTAASGAAMIYILYYFLPFILLYICFPWYAAIHKALQDDKLSKVDLAVQGIPFLFMGALDITCNIFATFFFFDLPFIRGDYTLSERCIYWWHNPQATYRHNLARMIKVLTDKYETGHIS